MEKRWPLAKIVAKSVNDLKPYARNARTHSAVQVAQIAESITQWGFTNPILIQPDGTIIAGHGRFLAAQSLSMAEVPVLVISGWTQEQIRAYVLADNKLAENAGWDEDLLKLELGDLKESGFDLGLAGYTDDEIDKLLTEPEAPDASPQITEMNYAIILRCDSEQSQMELLARFENEGLKCEALIS